MAVKYYIYLLRKRGKLFFRVIHYPASMRKVEVTWEEDDNLRMEQALKDVNQTVGEPVPPATLNKKMCSRCAYFDFCYA